MQVELHVYQSWITRAQDVLAGYDAIREVEEPPAKIDTLLADRLANLLEDLVEQIQNSDTISLS
jgi:hypothetical protein